MKRWMLWVFVLAGAGVAVMAQSHRTASARGVPGEAQLKARLHAFLDRTLGWQNLDKIEVETISKPDASGLRVAKVLLAKGAQHQEGTYYITADGKEVIEGQMSQLSADPWAGTRAKLQTAGAPAEGAVSAPVTIVEFSDLECPYCKEEAASLKQLMQEDPGKVRVVFKFYPLVKIHPWSMQAALAGACVARQTQTGFWDFEQAVFDAQDQITAATAAQRLSGMASESGVKMPAYNACITSAAARREVEASIADGNKVGVESTPTLFIDGRLVPGAVQVQQLRLLVDHEAGFAERTAAMTGQVSGEQCGSCQALPPAPKR